MALRFALEGKESPASLAPSELCLRGTADCTALSGDLLRLPPFEPQPFPPAPPPDESAREREASGYIVAVPWSASIASHHS